MRTRLLALLMLLGIAVSGCTGSTLSSGAGSDPVEGTVSGSAAQKFRYIDYDDIFIPNEMTYKGNESFFIGTGSDKLGLMFFTGRVEFRSLATTLIANMTNDGWTLNFNFVSSPRSVLIFSKSTRFCVMKIVDGTTRTELSVDVYPINGQERTIRPVISPSMGNGNGINVAPSAPAGGSAPLKEEGLSQ
ncbi:hypothetical protein N1030_12265 [Desulfovibrio mangrovi]|uniref:hypothetical protein n=1 Tax=Desulfovibrio mangrovi TaxID=2976983 RepID=UPI002247F30A|nr:hypothetical protein [Desulfovibrio mangrovi]UZP66380.1 hypothetical protein N1030_12265 [Desulfovibrio mangrovi]